MYILIFPWSALFTIIYIYIYMYVYIYIYIYICIHYICICRYIYSKPFIFLWAMSFLLNKTYII